MISKIKEIFKNNYLSKKEKPNSTQYIQPKGKKKLTKKVRKKLYEKEKKCLIVKEKMDLTCIDLIEDSKQNNIKNIKLRKKMFSILGSAFLLMGCQVSEPQEMSNINQNINYETTDVTLDTDTKSNQTIDIPADEVNSELDGPISIGDKITLNENARYYETAEMIGNGNSVENNPYVDSNDYNVISAVALVDQNNNVRYVNYEDSYEIFSVVEKAKELGITNYQIVLHCGPLNEDQKTDDVNEYQLGWSSINNMNKIKSKQIGK